MGGSGIFTALFLASNTHNIMAVDFIHNKAYHDEFFLGADMELKEFENCTFHYCDFTESVFTGSVFIDCTFLQCNFHKAPLGHLGLRNVQFTDCDMTSVNFAMTNQVIHEFHFTKCKLDYAQFYKLDIKNITFTDCSLISADFMECNLQEAMFDNCNLHLAVFIGADASKCDFSSSYHYSMNPAKTKLKKAIFSEDGLKGLLSEFDIIIR